MSDEQRQLSAMVWESLRTAVAASECPIHWQRAYGVIVIKDGDSPKS